MSIPNAITLACQSVASVPNLSPIGQLDIQTTGLLLLTASPNVSRLVNLPNTLPKTYRVSFDAPMSSPGLSSDQIASLTTPTDLTRDSDNGPVIASFSSLTNLRRRYVIDNPNLPPGIEPRARFCADCTISSGQNHVVKRLFASVKQSVRELRRIEVGPIVLPQGSTTDRASEDGDFQRVVVRGVKGGKGGKKRKVGDVGDGDVDVAVAVACTADGPKDGADSAQTAAPAPVELTASQLDSLLRAIKYEETGARLRRCDLICKSRHEPDNLRLKKWLNMSKEEEEGKCYEGFRLSCRLKHE
jgi:pseudouridine synthase